MSNRWLAVGVQQGAWISMSLTWLAITLLVGAYFVLKHRHYKISVKVEELEATVKLVLPISIAFRAELAARLTHDYGPELDALLVKVISDKGLTNEETDRILELLKERADAAIGVDERAAARMMPDVMDQATRDIQKR